MLEISLGMRLWPTWSRGEISALWLRVSCRGFWKSGADRDVEESLLGGSGFLAVVSRSPVLFGREISESLVLGRGESFTESLVLGQREKFVYW